MNTNITPFRCVMKRAFNRYKKNAVLHQALTIDFKYVQHLCVAASNKSVGSVRIRI